MNVGQLVIDGSGAYRAYNMGKSKQNALHRVNEDPTAQASRNDPFSHAALTAYFRLGKLSSFFFCFSVFRESSC